MPSDPPATSGKSTRLLITAGPTQEPIDAVRFIGNRSSGRLGVALASEGVRRGWETTVLLGPTAVAPDSARLCVVRFRTTEDLRRLLGAQFESCDVLIMAAAVADFRPVPSTGASGGVDTKWRRGAGRITLDLEPTPDLLAQCAARRRPGQTIVGFALEPDDRLLESAREKLRRKGVDMVVANPLSTMDSPTIRAWLVTEAVQPLSTDGAISKEAFASWLLDRIEAHRSGDRRSSPSR